MTREIAQAAGTPLQAIGPSETLTAEIRKLWSEARPHIDEAQFGARFPAWRTDAAQAGALRQELHKVLGNRPTPQPQAAAQEIPTDVPTEVLLGEGQRKALCGHASRAGATTREQRAVLWAYLLNAPTPIGTKALTEAQATVLLETLSSWSTDEAVQGLSEAVAQGGGYLMPTPPPLPQRERDALAQQFAQAPVASQAPLMAEWTARYGADAAYNLMLEGAALILWPDRPEAFRNRWFSPTVLWPEIRQTALRLSDAEITQISASLRGVFVRGGRPEDVWSLAFQLAGVA